nr:hypothetical protein [Tanacetum cinerariifolium]
LTILPIEEIMRMMNHLNDDDDDDDVEKDDEDKEEEEHLAPADPSDVSTDDLTNKFVSVAHFVLYPTKLE